MSLRTGIFPGGSLLVTASPPSPDPPMHEEAERTRTGCATWYRPVDLDALNLDGAPPWRFWMRAAIASF